MNWTPEFELEYVRSTSRDELLSRMREFATILELDTLKVSPESVVVDVGCGPVGGLLNFVAGNRVGIDHLADEYRALGWTDIPLMPGKAEAIPLRDESVDLLFCIESLDHCDSMQVFRKAQQELCRVLKPGGTLFFMLPARDQPREGHPCAPDSRNVDGVFIELGMALEKANYKREGIWRRWTK